MVVRALLWVMTAVLTVAGVWALIRPEPETHYVNFEIVLDRSARMDEQLADGATRLDLAVGAVNDVVKELGADKADDNANLGLRTVGGDCDSEGDRTVDIGTGHADDIVDAGESVQPSGDAPLGAAIMAAASDLADVERFPPDVDKRIVVISGGADSCNPNAAEEVRTRLTAGDSKLALEFRLVGVGVPEAERAAYEQFASDVPGAQVVFADDEESLRDAIDEFIAREPVLKGAQAVLAAGQGAVEHLKSFDSSVYEAFNSQDDDQLAGAEKALADAENELAASELPFLALEHGPAEARLETLHAKVTELRGIDRRAIDQGGVFLDDVEQYLAGDRSKEATTATAERYERLKEMHNSTIGEIDQELAELGVR